MKTAEEWADIIAAYQTRGALAHIVDEIRREQHEATMAAQELRKSRAHIDMRCQNCRYWNDGHCLNEKLESPDNDGLISYYGERTKTGPDFGCIHFEMKGERDGQDIRID